MMASVIARRLLVNYRLDPVAAARILPRGMRPDLANGYAVGGICLIRLTHLRPAGLPAALGVTTENAAHRIGVVWQGPHGEQRGVYIPRRDTSSRLTALVGGRVFPGEHHRARFEVRESGDRMRVDFAGTDSTVRVEVGTGDNPFTSVLFDDVSAASDYFRDAPIGRSARASGDELDSVQLTTEHWSVEPTTLLSVESSFFSDPARFPAGTAEPDSALLMRGIPALWAPEPA
jgi:hypothetical protein